MDYGFIIEDLENIVNRLVLPERKPHVEGVVDFCRRLSKRYNVDSKILEIMALAHDVFRDVEATTLMRMARAYNIQITELHQKKPILLHGLVAAEFIKSKYGITDEDVLLGVAYHTSGHSNFGTYSKMLALADSLEFTRVYDKVNQLRELAFYDMEIAYKEVIRNKIIYAVNYNLYVLPYTLETWNNLVEGGN
ncbi:MAG: bis(5'-nucleosyl)-tetraphosphatase (symmetrical) YqeK [Fervidobacterium sp.]|uniref:bis(5'-nucleosyl)-tetraphosphatase (symmetrical) YqeK n=1 Tax=Fervidobacterium sp. TaxID=1871331 RepID=UPI00404A98B3